MLLYIIFFLITFLIIYIIFLYLLKIKIEKFEGKILELFKEKNNLIPSIYEVSKKYLIKHEEIFTEIISLKKKDFSENISYNKLIEKSNTYKKIHNELNFIFRVCNKNQKINKDNKYLYIRDLIIEKSSFLGNNLDVYKKIVKKFNNLVTIKNLTIIGLFIPIEKKETI